ncbi:MAG: hypothetical protein K9W43_00625 [Candidatus Thorarchaeota archaeon]|nr:hypothetical protein [Candidatus Thorarchaeota archaeon]
MVYLAAGVTLKLGDDLLDELNRPRLAWIPLLLAGVSFGILMTQTEWDLVLMTAIILAVIASGKVNRPQFFIGFVMIGGILWYVGIPQITNWFVWVTILVTLMVGAALDEWGNDRTERFSKGMMNTFFEYRFTLKLSALVLGMFWREFIPTAIGLWLFDIGYELTRKAVTFVLEHDDRQDYNTHQERLDSDRGA